MKYVIPLAVLLPVVLGQGLVDILEGTECEQLYESLRDAMESRRQGFYGPQDFFAELGLSAQNRKQLKKFACKLPDIHTIRELADIAPEGTQNLVAKKYLEMVHNLNVDAGGVNKTVKTFRLYVAIGERGKFLPSDIVTLPWYVDENDALIFFSRLARDFGPDFPTFLMQRVSSFKRQFFNMTDVPEFVNSLYRYDSIDKAAEALHIRPRVLEAFLRVLYFAKEEDISNIQLYKRTARLLEKLGAIGFFKLSII